MVTLRPRSTSSRPSDAAAMPFPSEDTTPPVTKMYLVELGPVVIRPAPDKRASELPLVEGPRACPHPAGPARLTVLPRWLNHDAAPAAAPVVPPAPQERVSGLS